MKSLCKDYMMPLYAYTRVLHRKNFHNKNLLLVIMAKAHSPTHFNVEPDNFYDPNFTLDINTRMRVPKSIRVNGDYDGGTMMANGSAWNQASATEKIEMHVPDRILVVGEILF